MDEPTTKSDSTSRYCNRLREALDEVPALRRKLQGWFDFPAKRETVMLNRLEAAARRFLALTETGQENRWCANHNMPALPDKPTVCFDEGLPWEKGIAHPFGLTGCKIVPVLVIPVDYLTEEESE